MNKNYSMNNSIPNLNTAVIGLLQRLIATPSFSREEQHTADHIEQFLQQYGVATHRNKYNIWAKNRHFDPAKPVILLNSHHDTVLPNQGYTRDPFSPDIVDGKLYGLGSNDAGGALTCLLVRFGTFSTNRTCRSAWFNAATAEEEISGSDGVERVLPDLGKIDFAIVGEPTKMHMAIAEGAHGARRHSTRPLRARCPGRRRQRPVQSPGRYCLDSRI